MYIHIYIHIYIYTSIFTYIYIYIYTGGLASPPSTAAKGKNGAVPVTWPAGEKPPPKKKTKGAKAAAAAAAGQEGTAGAMGGAITGAPNSVPAKGKSKAKGANGRGAGVQVPAGAAVLGQMGGASQQRLGYGPKVSGANTKDPSAATSKTAAGRGGHAAR